MPICNLAGALAKKHKLLIALAVDMVIHAEGGMKALAGQALAEGATPQELVEAFTGLKAWVDSSS